MQLLAEVCDQRGWGVQHRIADDADGTDGHDVQQ
jgi:hypothetical protein